MNSNMQLPEEFCRKMSELLGEREAAFCAAMQRNPEISIRLNCRKPSDAGMDAEPVSWCANGRYLSERPVFTLDPLLHAGAYYVQDASSMIHEQIARLVSERLEKESGEDAEPLNVLDLCAAPGGKTTAIINALPDGTIVVANEIDRGRNAILRENLVKWGYPEIVVTCGDAASLGRAENMFDIISVDAPCSGEGMMRKDPDALTQWSMGLVTSCSTLQKKILDDILPALRPGGYLIYSTCTFNREEDEENVEYLVSRHGLESIELPLEGTEGLSHAIKSDVHALRFMPHEARGEGLFVAVLRKPYAPYFSPKLRITDPTSGKSGRKVKTKDKAKSNKRANTWNGPTISTISEHEVLKEKNGTLFAMSPRVGAMHDYLERLTCVTLSGSPIGEVKGNLVLPDSRQVLRASYESDSYPMVELNREQALNYLRREAIELSAETPKGYVVVSYNGHPLGMLKNLGNRCNNMYPQSWKIRMRS